jgi:hypothetical protein
MLGYPWPLTVPLKGPVQDVSAWTADAPPTSAAIATIRACAIPLIGFPLSLFFYLSLTA